MSVYFIPFPHLAADTWHLKQFLRTIVSLPPVSSTIHCVMKYSQWGLNFAVDFPVLRFYLSYYDICCHFYVVCMLLTWSYLFFISLRCPHWGCQSLWLFCLLLSRLVHRHHIFSLHVLAGARCYVWKSISRRIWGLGWHSSPLKRATMRLGCPYSKIIFNCGEDWVWGVK